MNWWRSARRPPPSRFCTRARAWPRTCAAGKRADTHQRRAPSEEPPRASGVDALAHGALGAQHRPEHGPAVRADHERQAHPEMGYRGCLASSGWLGNTRRNAWRPPPNAPLLTGACPLQERRVDSENRSTGCRRRRRHPLPRRRTTTSAVRNTSSEAHHANRTDDGKTDPPCGCWAWWTRCERRNRTRVARVELPEGSDCWSISNERRENQALAPRLVPRASSIADRPAVRAFPGSSTRATRGPVPALATRPPCPAAAWRSVFPSSVPVA